MATTNPTRLLIAEPPPIHLALPRLRQVLADATYPVPELMRADHTPAAGRAWDALIDEAVDEILPDVQQLLRQAIARRLPWRYPAG